MCSPSEVRILLAAAAMRCSWITNANIKPTFLQTGCAQREVYVVPPRENTDRSHYWLLLTADNGRVNSNAKWLDQSDAPLQDLCLLQHFVTSQLFSVMENNFLVLLVAKIVDDLFSIGDTTLFDSFTRNYDVFPAWNRSIRARESSVLRNKNHTRGRVLPFH